MSGSFRPSTRYCGQGRQTRPACMLNHQNFAVVKKDHDGAVPDFFALHQVVGLFQNRTSAVAAHTTHSRPPHAPRGFRSTWWLAAPPHGREHWNQIGDRPHTGQIRHVLGVAVKAHHIQNHSRIGHAISVSSCGEKSLQTRKKQTMAPMPSMAHAAPTMPPPNQPRRTPIHAPPPAGWSLRRSARMQFPDEPSQHSQHADLAQSSSTSGGSSRTRPPAEEASPKEPSSGRTLLMLLTRRTVMAAPAAP